MMTEPGIDERAARPCVGIRTRVTLPEMGPAIPRLLGEVGAWLQQRGVAPAGAPYIRYHVINMAEKLEIELGFPVAGPIDGDATVTAGELPAGRYASLVYTGIANGFNANLALMNWGEAQGLKWDSRMTDKGEAFGARLESYLTDPAVEPDQAKWQTEVAIRLAE